MNNSELKISLVGDIFPGELPYTISYGIRSQFVKHRGLPWKDKIHEILGENDLVIGNLESPLVEESKTLKKTFFGERSFAEFLSNCGINILNIANNHILEQGSIGFESTIKAIEKANLNVIGNVENNKSKIVIKEVKGFKIALAGFSNVDLKKIKNDNHFAVLTENNVLETIEQMKQLNANLIILSLHWGNEYIQIPSYQQRKMAYKFIDAGVDIIAGHHPHVIQPHEEYKGKHIFYSLGNFLFDYIQSKQFGLGLKVSILFSQKSGFRVTVAGVRLSYKNTLESIPAEDFERNYIRIIKNYKRVRELDQVSYERFYTKTLERNHLIERFTMKTSLLIEFLRISLTDKRKLLSNLVRLYIRKM